MDSCLLYIWLTPDLGRRGSWSTGGTGMQVRRQPRLSMAGRCVPLTCRGSKRVTSLISDFVFRSTHQRQFARPASPACWAAQAGWLGRCTARARHARLDGATESSAHHCCFGERTGASRVASRGSPTPTTVQRNAAQGTHARLHAPRSCTWALADVLCNAEGEKPVDGREKTPGPQRSDKLRRLTARRSLKPGHQLRAPGSTRRPTRFAKSAAQRAATSASAVLKTC
jgi:hypothetical protein